MAMAIATSGTYGLLCSSPRTRASGIRALLVEHQSGFLSGLAVLQEATLGTEYQGYLVERVNCWPWYECQCQCQCQCHICRESGCILALSQDAIVHCQHPYNLITSPLSSLQDTMKAKRGQKQINSTLNHENSILFPQHPEYSNKLCPMLFWS